MKHYTYKDVLRGLIVFFLATMVFGIVNGLLEQWAPSGGNGL
jgi:hypothetical protein